MNNKFMLQSTLNPFMQVLSVWSVVLIRLIQILLWLMKAARTKLFA